MICRKQTKIPTSHYLSPIKSGKMVERKKGLK